jgi:hypothetical protein
MDRMSTYVVVGQTLVLLNAMSLSAIPCMSDS